MRSTGLKIRPELHAQPSGVMLALAIVYYAMVDCNHLSAQEHGKLVKQTIDLPAISGSDSLAQPHSNVTLLPPRQVIPVSQSSVAPILDESEATFSVPSIPFAIQTPSTQNSQGSVDPWWFTPALAPLRPETHSLPINLDTLFALTAAYSGRVQAIAQEPWGSQAQLEQAQAAFDPTLFSNNRFNSTSDPVENRLVTGGPPRLEDNIVSLDSGIRGQNQRGFSYQMGQRFGHKNSNSLFFEPQDQGTARLYANVTQPLMRGRKTDVNRSLVLTAQFETHAAQAEYQETLQKQLFQVADAYWSLYTERVSLLQGRQHLTRACEIADLLQAREGYDSPSSQVLRARATVANRTAQLAQADAKIKNLESRLRALVNAPELLNNRSAEFLPSQSPELHPIELVLEREVDEALQRRPELKELSNKLEVAKVRLQLARDQTKPTLNLVGEGYLAGLQGQSDIPGAFVDQFSQGGPGYAAGLVFERPVGNRAAMAAVRQRHFEVAQIHHLLNEATENVRAEIESAIRNVDAAKQAALSRQTSLEAANVEVIALKDRWQTLGNDPRIGPLQLNDLLSSQDRLLQEEQNLLQALVEYNRAILEVQRASGALVQFSN